jgi:hypothetical protein
MKSASVLVLIIAAAAVAGVQIPWVDMTGCPICVNVSNEEGLTENMIWEHHLTASGAMTVFTVKPDYQEKFERAKGRMKEILGKVVEGEEIEVCGYCTSLATLLKRGAKAENIVTSASDVTLLSATDQTVIKEIREHGQKTIDFIQSSHTGHDR